ncbi:MAG: hypothetical protein Q4F97_06780 [Bacteroidales bacterium]|nr:hypothetical protein [Bacteroidales bacterium]
MKNSVSLFTAFAILSILFVSCGKSKSDDKSAQPAAEQKSSVMPVDDLLNNAENLIGQSVELEGVCTHICQHSAKKIFLMGSDDTKTIRIESGELGSFDQKCVNSIVTVKGKLVEEKIDEKYLQNWEAKLALQAQENHGDSEAGCSTEKKARGETANSPSARIAEFRKRIAERNEKSGKNYLSFYHVVAEGYSINE